MSGGREWTMPELRRLREDYPRFGATYCADALERTKHAVYRKAIELGVSEKDRARAQRHAYPR